MQDESIYYTDKKSASNFECDGSCCNNVITVRLQYVRVYLVAYVCYLLSTVYIIHSFVFSSLCYVLCFVPFCGQSAKGN